MPHPKIPEGVPRENWPFSLQFQNSAKQSRTKPNLTQNTLGPLDETDPDRLGGFRSSSAVVGTGKREEEAGSRGKRCHPAWSSISSGSWFRRGRRRRFRMACSASGKSFGHGPCPKWPARREHGPTIPPVGKREELRTRTACRSGQREETGGQRGIRRVSLRLVEL